jgi:hypothetical protein
MELTVEAGEDARSAVPVIVGVLIVPAIRFLVELPVAIVRGRRR